jgi:type I restriction enzyme M protein
MARAKSPASSSQSSATIGSEAKLWLAADKWRNNMVAAVTERSDRRRQPPEPYKHVVLGLTFRSV